jgi:uncharacterized cysteine cluster protein YcgN (CxxCxxCC family)
LKRGDLREFGDLRAMTDQKDSQNSPFWEKRTLQEMTRQEWESLCDGCGRCCLNKIEYTDTNEIFYTKVSCKLLNSETCQCSNYAERMTYVPDCIVLTPETISRIDFMPQTCAYRLLAEGKSLESWHPLISGTKESVHQAGISVKGRVISEEGIDSLEEHIIRWIPPIRRKKQPKAKKKRSSQK